MSITDMRLLAIEKEIPLFVSPLLRCIHLDTCLEVINESDGKCFRPCSMCVRMCENVCVLMYLALEGEHSAQFKDEKNKDDQKRISKNLSLLTAKVNGEV